MKPSSTVLILAAALATSAHGAEIYTGVGTSGLMLGLSYTLSPHFVARADVMGGLNLTRDGTREGINFKGYLRNNRAGAFIDWFPFTGRGWRLTGGVTMNSIKLGLDSTVNNLTASVNGKTVNLSGETFNVMVKYPTFTPYLGLGYGHQPTDDTGLGFHIDVGVMFGRFDANITTSLIGKQGITADDVNAEARALSRSVSKLSVLPAASVGLNLRF